MKRTLVVILIVLTSCTSKHHTTSPPRRTVAPPSTFSVTVHWGFVPLKTVTGYRVYRGTVLGHESQLLGTVSPKQNWWIDWKVPYIPTGSYYYRVRTVASTLVSVKSAPMIANGQGIPTDPLKGLPGHP